MQRAARRAPSNASFFLSLRTRKIFFAFELPSLSPLVRSLLFLLLLLLTSRPSLASRRRFFPRGSPPNFAPFDPTNSLNCYSVRDELPSLDVVNFSFPGKGVEIFNSPRLPHRRINDLFENCASTWPARGRVNERN